jgi:hypothetical protein
MACFCNITKLHFLPVIMELGIDLLVDFFRSGPPLPSHSSVVRGRPLYQPVFVETPLFAAAERKNVHGETDPDGAKTPLLGH